MTRVPDPLRADSDSVQVGARPPASQKPAPLRAERPPRILDLFCGVGGASVGYARAGFDVVGVDIADQPDYPFPDHFHRLDVMDVLSRHTPETMRAWGYDAIHASPPCQNQAAITKGTNAHLRDRYPDLYPDVKTLLDEIGLPYVIENPSSRPDIVLCGEMFGLGVLRHRRFEIGPRPASLDFTPKQPEHLPHRGRVAGMRHGEWFEGPYFAVYGNGGGKGSVAQWREAMGIDWTWNRKSIAEAIPPAYTEWIGTRLLAALPGSVGA